MCWLQIAKQYLISGREHCISKEHTSALVNWIRKGVLHTAILARNTAEYHRTSFKLGPPVADACGCGVLGSTHWQQAPLNTHDTVLAHHLATWRASPFVSSFASSLRASPTGPNRSSVPNCPCRTLRTISLFSLGYRSGEGVLLTLLLSLGPRQKNGNYGTSYRNNQEATS